MFNKQCEAFNRRLEIDVWINSDYWKGEGYNSWDGERVTPFLWKEDSGIGGGGCMFLVSSKISVIFCDNLNKFSLRFFYWHVIFLTGEIHNKENIFLTENLTSIFCLKVSRNTSHDNSRCFNLSSKYRFYLYCNLRR